MTVLEPSEAPEPTHRRCGAYDPVLDAVCDLRRGHQHHHEHHHPDGPVRWADPPRFALILPYADDTPRRRRFRR